MQKEISLKKELIRKSIHIATSLIPITYYYYGNKELILVLCISLFVLFLLGDILRIYVTQMKQIYEKIFGSLLRENESGKSLNGATLLFLGFSIVIILFDKNIAVISMFYLSLADSSAAIFGKRFGRHPVFKKSIEGALAFFISAFIIGLLFFNNAIASLLIALIVSVIELLPVKINDNLTIPAISGFLFTIVNNI